MSKWSSFKRQQLLTENWRKYLNEKQVDEGLVDFLKKRKTGKEGGAETFPASALMSITGLMVQLAKKHQIQIDMGQVVNEFESLLNKQQFELKEAHPEALIFGKPLDFNIGESETPNLHKFVTSLAAKDKKAFDKFHSVLSRAGFSDKSLNAVLVNIASISQRGPESTPGPVAPSRSQIVKPSPGVPGEPPRRSTATPGEETTPAFQTSRSDLMAILKDPAEKSTAGTRFRTALHQYFKASDVLPGGVNRDSPLIKGIVNVVRDSLIALGMNPKQKELKESINKIFLPIIIEEVKKEKGARLFVEEITRVLNEKIRFKTIN